MFIHYLNTSHPTRSSRSRTCFEKKISYEKICVFVYIMLHRQIIPRNQLALAVAQLTILHVHLYVDIVYTTDRVTRVIISHFQLP